MLYGVYLSTGSSNSQGEGPRHSTERSLDQSPTQGEGTGPSHSEKTWPPCQQEYQCEFTLPSQREELHSNTLHLHIKFSFRSFNRVYYHLYVQEFLITNDVVYFEVHNLDFKNVKKLYQLFVAS